MKTERMNAYHEVGHAVAHWELDGEIRHISIIRNNQGNGEVEPATEFVDKLLEVQTLLAGDVSEAFLEATDKRRYIPLNANDPNLDLNRVKEILFRLYNNSEVRVEDEIEKQTKLTKELLDRPCVRRGIGALANRLRVKKFLRGNRAKSIYLKARGK